MSDVDDYLDKVSAPERIELQRIREIVKTLVPDAIEVISYKIPGFKYKNNYLLGYCSYKNHLSIFPTSQPIEALKDKLKDYNLSKGTIQFTLEKTLPESTIKELVKYRVLQILNK